MTSQTYPQNPVTIINDSTLPIPVTIDAGGDQAISDGSAVDGSGTITTGTGTVIAANLDGYSTVTFSVSGTYSGFSATFEQSDDAGTTWYAVDAAQIGTGVIENGCTLLTNTNRMWRATTSGSD